MTDYELASFDYRFAKQVVSRMPGAHRSRSHGAGEMFADYCPLAACSDPRRLDVRASLRANSGKTEGIEWLVRRYRQRAVIRVALLLDLSRSLMASLVDYKALADVASMIAYSVVKSGDRFGLYAFDSEWREDASLLLAKRRSLPAETWQCIADAKPPAAPGIAGIFEAIAMLPAGVELVFIVSDFYAEPELIDRALTRLADCVVVPVVWRRPPEEWLLNYNGWTVVEDAESGEQRQLWLRPTLRKRWKQQARDFELALEQVFTHHRLEPLITASQPSAERFNAYFGQIQAGL